eukprot:TRINITY_DN17439_c0_g1_i1.p1 TRINITY_DN17439_c0_g1~~TRINITY_DN17439_c0_g1_i1.p1  ORF type:complete len:275 (-),score=30.02 TRINITY_DN17439_c0_g1_i1:88-912(-)
MNNSNQGVCPLRLLMHEHPEIYDRVAGILNEQWPRSTQSRLISFVKSSEYLPVHLAFAVNDSGDGVDVSIPRSTLQDPGMEASDDDPSVVIVGHSQLSEVQRDSSNDSDVGSGAADSDGDGSGRSSKEALITSVIVDGALRGMGYGKQVMLSTEQYAQSVLGIDVLYLSTKDKQSFYAHLGYVECGPVTSLGSNKKRLTSGQVSLLEGAFGGAKKPSALPTTTPAPQPVTTDVVVTPPPPSSCPMPPPPPPPSVTKVQPVPETWMMKRLVPLEL